MISPECIDFSALPSLPIEQRKNLPNTSGVYFVIDSSGNVLYIGRSSNFQQRWIKHHKSDELQKLTNISLTWIEVSETSSLPEIEAALIEWFNPPLNCYPVYSPRQLPELSGFIKWRLNAVMADREVDNNQLHELTGLHVGTISRLRNNPPDRVDIKTLDLLCKALRCQPGELLVHIPGKEEDK